MMERRVRPLRPDELDDVQRGHLAGFTDRHGRYPNIFGILARNMPLLEAWTGFGLYLMRGSRVDPLLREVLILRTACNSRSDYEWHQHRRIALKLGMKKSEIDAVRSGVTGDVGRDLMIRCADELERDRRVSDVTWKAMTASYGFEYTLDAIFTVGAYTALAMALNSVDVEIELARGSQQP